MIKILPDNSTKRCFTLPAREGNRLTLQTWMIKRRVYCLTEKGGDHMASRVARVTDIIAASPKSFDDAIQAGFKRAIKTLRGITGMRVLEQRIAVENNKVIEYRVKLEVIFVLES